MFFIGQENQNYIDALFLKDNHCCHCENHGKHSEATKEQDIQPNISYLLCMCERIDPC